MKQTSRVSKLIALVPLLAASLTAEAALYNISGVVVNLPTQPTTTNPLTLAGSFANVRQTITGDVASVNGAPIFRPGATLSGSGDIATLGATGNTSSITCALTTYVANPYCNVHFTFSGFTLSRRAVTTQTDVDTGSSSTTGVAYYYEGGTVSVFVDQTNDGVKNGTLWLSTAAVNHYANPINPPPNFVSLVANVSYVSQSAEGNTALNITGGSGAGNFVTTSAVDFFSTLSFQNINTTCTLNEVITAGGDTQVCTAGSGPLSTLISNAATPYSPPVAPPVVNTVPTPATLSLMGLCLIGLGWSRRRNTGN